MLTASVTVGVVLLSGAILAKIVGDKLKEDYPKLKEQLTEVLLHLQNKEEVIEKSKEGDKSKVKVKAQGSHTSATPDPDWEPDDKDHKNDPYEEAMKGGKHHRWAKEYINKPKNMLKKGIRSLEKQIKIHEDKIVHPAKYVKTWQDESSLYKAGLLKKWRNDIIKQQEQKRILEGILQSRK